MTAGSSGVQGRHPGSASRPKATQGPVHLVGERLQGSRRNEHPVAERVENEYQFGGVAGSEFAHRDFPGELVDMDGATRGVLGRPQAGGGNADD